MPTDRTRPSDDLRQGYRGVRFQQGRVVLDRDLNAGEEISAAEFRFVGLDVVGPFGSPDDGYKIIPDTAKKHDFGISSGSIYVGGVRITLPSATTYFTQPDSLTREDAKPADAKPWNELVYLRVSQVEVSAREDADLADVGLGGPDSAGRVRMLARVERMPTTAADCTGAFAELVSKSKDLGFKFDAPTHLLLPRGKLLKVAFDTTTTAATLCQPEAAGGYLHPDNQCVRIKHAAANELIWGFDNASFLYTIDETLPITTTTTLKILPAPPDESRYPKANQYVELLRAVANLPQGGFLAEPDGFVTKLTSDYNPDTGQVTLTGPVPAAYQEAKHKLFLRVWESKVEADGRLVAVSAPAGPTGLRVELTDGEAKYGPAVNSYWVFAPRPMTPQKVYPERFTKAAQIADGPYDWIAPLAFLKWPTTGTLAAAAISDCRPHFDNLVELTEREPVAVGGGGCCTITVSPEDVRSTDEFRKQLIEARKQTAGCLRVCFRPGVYKLDRPLKLTAELADVVLEGCCGVILRAGVDAKLEHVDGLIQVIGAANVTLRHLHIEPLPVYLVKALEGRVAKEILEKLDEELPELHSVVAVRAVGAKNLTLDYCTVQLNVPKETIPGFGVGLMSSHDGTGLKVRDCVFRHDRPVVKREDPNRRLRVADQLKRIGEAIAQYPRDRGQPSHLGDLIAAKVLKIPEVVNTDRGLLIPPVESRRLNEWLDQHAAFGLTKPGDPDQPAGRIVAHESVEQPGDSMGLLFANKRVAFVATEPARDLILQAGGRLREVALTRPFRALFGSTHVYYSLPQLNERTPSVLDSLLDDAEIDRNQYGGLAVAGVAFGSVGTVAIRRNDVRDCTAGFWIMSSESPGLPPVKDSEQLEVSKVSVLLRVFPLPPEFDLKPDDPLIVDTRTWFPIQGGRFEVALSDNRMEPLTAQISETEMIRVSAPELLEVMGLKSTVILANNMVRGRSREAVVVFVAEAERLTLTGNVIVNDATGGDKPRLSLWVTPFKMAKGETAEFTAVTGNVLQGKSNLDEVQRPFPLPFHNWKSFNAESP